MMRLLDLFCGAGGAAMGYHQAGFTEIVGVDNRSQPRYPFTFVQADALGYVAKHGQEFDVIHASPPCQAYSVMSRQSSGAQQTFTWWHHADLYISIREALQEINIPWVIENVIGAPYEHGIVLCGSMFGLVVRRHRHFESQWPLALTMQCTHEQQGRPITITGNGGAASRHSDKGVKAEWPAYMGMPWATPHECTQAIPPAYTCYIGTQLLLRGK